MSIKPQRLTPTESTPLPPDYYDKVVTEDDIPVDNIYSEKQQRLLTEPLYSSWSGPGKDRTFAVFSNVGLFYEVKVPPIVPDAFLSLDVVLPEDPWGKKNRSYFVWEYKKPPEIAIEVVSNKEGGELTDKKIIYAQAKVPYYVVWDPELILSDEPLKIFELNRGKYRLMEKDYFPEIGLGITSWNGVYEEWDKEWLRWCDKKGNLILTGAERAEHEAGRADQAARRAEHEAGRADQAKEELEKTRQEMERMKEILREKGIQLPPPK